MLEINSSMKAEKSESFDFGIEKSFSNLGLSIDASYFNIKYMMHSKVGNIKRLVNKNFPGTVKISRIGISFKWKKSDKLNFDLNYTYTSTYDGAEQDDPDKNESYHDARWLEFQEILLI